MLFMVWRRRTLALAYARGMQLIRKLGELSPEGVGVLNVVESEAVPPDSEARRAFVELFHQKELKHFSVTHEGDGFKAASVRAIAAAAHAMARPHCAHSVHSSVVAAAQWHASEQRKLGRSEQGSQILVVTQGLRKIHFDRYPPPRA